jgi:hypothetical protein
MEAPAPGRCFEITVPAQEGGAGAPAGAATATTIHAMRLAEADAAVWGAIMLQENDLGPLIGGTQNYQRRERLVIFGGNEEDLHAFEVMHRVQIARTFYVSTGGVRCLMVKAAANAGRLPGPACVRWRAALRGAVEADEEEENEGKGSEGGAPNELDLTEEPPAAARASQTSPWPHHKACIVQRLPSPSGSAGNGKHAPATARPAPARAVLGAAPPARCPTTRSSSPHTAEVRAVRSQTSQHSHRTRLLPSGTAACSAWPASPRPPRPGALPQRSSRTAVFALTAKGALERG